MTETSPIEIDLSMEFSSLRVPVLCCSMDRGRSTSRPAALTTIYSGDEIHDVPGLLACARNCAKLHGCARISSRADASVAGCQSRAQWSRIDAIAAMRIKCDVAWESGPPECEMARFHGRACYSNGPGLFW